MFRNSFNINKGFFKAKINSNISYDFPISIKQKLFHLNPISRFSSSCIKNEKFILKKLMTNNINITFKKNYSQTISISKNDDEKNIKDKANIELNDNNSKSSRKRKKIINKEIKVKNYSDKGKLIASVLINNSILNTKFAVYQNDESIKKEKLLHESIIKHLTEGWFKDSISMLEEILEFLKSLENEEKQNLFLKVVQKISDKILLKKIQIYQLCLVDIFYISEKVEEAEFYLDNLINFLEVNFENLFEQDKYLLIKSREKLCNSYLNKDEFDFFELNLNEKCKSLIQSNTDFLEKRLLSQEIQKQENLFLSFQKFLMENYYILGMIFKKENNFVDSNNSFFKYLKIKENYPILSQYTINLEYSLHLNLGLNFLKLNDNQKSVEYFLLALDYLKDEKQIEFIEAKIMVLDKLSDIYGDNGDNEKFMHNLEEKKRLAIDLIEMKKILFEVNKINESEIKNTEDNPNRYTNLEGNIDNSGKDKNGTSSDKISKDLDSNNNNQIENPDLKTVKNSEETVNSDFKSNPIFNNYENSLIKNDYLNLAKIYEELIEFYIETELRLEKIEEYIIEAQKYYDLFEKDSIFSSNLIFILFMKNYDFDSNFDISLEKANKLIEIFDRFENGIIPIIEAEFFDELNEEEIDFFQIEENFFTFDKIQKKEFLLRRFSNLDWYNFSTRFKFYFSISNIYARLKNTEGKVKFQDLALDQYEENINTQNISVFHLVDLMRIFEDKKNSVKLYEIFEKIHEEIKQGNINYVKNEDKELYSKTIFDVYYMKINMLILEEKFNEAKDTLKILNGISLADINFKLEVDDKENLDKTMNLLDLKLKYIS